MSKQPFPAPVCAKLERILELEEQAKLRRKDLFDARDHADEELSALGPSQESKREHLEADFGRCVREIKRWDKAIKRMDADLRETIKGGRQLTLRDEEPGQLKIDDYLNAADTEEEEGEEESAEDKANRGARNVRGRVTEFETPEGEDEHLNAAVTELNLPDNLTKILTGAGYDKIGQVAKALDSEEGLDIKGMGDVKIAEITKAVKAYRRRHRQADAQREKEAVGA